MSRTEESIARAQELADELSGRPENVDAALPELAGLLQGSADPELLIAVALALGEAWDERAASLLLPLADHRDPLVREAVAHALPNGVVSAGPRGQVAAALVALASDPAEPVRTWACYGLGQLEVDGPEVRAALLGNLDREDLDTRSEALLALARLGDPTSLAATIERLGADPDDIALLELQAAAELADPVLVPVLERLGTLWTGDDDDHARILDFALLRCRPTAAAAAALIEAELLQGVSAGLRSTGVAVRLEGSYPRTVLHLAREDGGEPELYRVWDDEEPGSFDLEQQVTGYVLTAQD
ncbi:MAG: hypothetical protein QOE76_1272 [Frankiales bacterium]|jgi:HEAT repeat protein|nr:hypothetical protein [Frankiales bacterium]